MPAAEAMTINHSIDSFNRVDTPSAYSDQRRTGHATPEGRGLLPCSPSNKSIRVMCNLCYRLVPEGKALVDRLTENTHISHR